MSRAFATESAARYHATFILGLTRYEIEEVPANKYVNAVQYVIIVEAR